VLWQANSIFFPHFVFGAICLPIIHLKSSNEYKAVSSLAARTLFEISDMRLQILMRDMLNRVALHVERAKPALGYRGTLAMVLVEPVWLSWQATTRMPSTTGRGSVGCCGLE